ncbi:MAG: hypothetical protein ACLQVD_14380 [Capsulimonadaceae bacterium]
MSEPILGEVNVFPWVPIRTRTASGVYNVRFLVDTGFKGELAVPSGFQSVFGTSVNTRGARYADGRNEDRTIVECEVYWHGAYRLVTAMYIHGENPLIGAELLQGSRLTAEFEEGGEVSVEQM